MFEWWAERRRASILAQPFPAEHGAVLERNVKHYARLDAAAQKRLRDLVQVFIAEKRWEGCGGLELSDEMRVTIAAQACLLVLELPHRLYEDVESILVYPSTLLRPEHGPGVFVRSSTPVASGPIALLGEAHARGPVVLAWDRVLRDGRHPHDGHNLVYHEFAVFEPMESGREGARGMGLTIARDIVEGVGGTIEIVHDGRRKGATVRMLLFAAAIGDVASSWRECAACWSDRRQPSRQCWNRSRGLTNTEWRWQVFGRGEWRILSALR